MLHWFVQDQALNALMNATAYYPWRQKNPQHQLKKKKIPQFKNWLKCGNRVTKHCLGHTHVSQTFTARYLGLWVGTFTNLVSGSRVELCTFSSISCRS